MRFGAGILLGLVLTGCAAHAPKSPATRALESAVYQDRPAAALVFDPPAAYGSRVELDRDLREPRAFVGFDQFTTTYFEIHSDDRQSDDGDSFFERRAISDRFGVSSR